MNGEPCDREAAIAHVAAELRRLQRRLRRWRIPGWLAQACLAVLLVMCFIDVAGDASLWPGYVCVLVIVLAVFHLLPAALWRWLESDETRVDPRGGNEWRIGRYARSDVLAAFDQATAELPRRMRRATVRIAKMRGVQGWTALNLIWPGWGRAPVVRISSGSLHYLEPCELQALLLHEVGHHAPRNRLGPPGGWLLMDLFFASWLFYAHRHVALSPGGSVAIVLLVRGAFAMVAAMLTQFATRSIEHACDLFAASRVGPEPVANLLLKLGEETELTEAVLALAARRLLYVGWLEVDDLAMAFDEVRPEGRIFHNNLFRHSVAVVEWLTDLGDVKLPSPTAKRRANGVLRAFLDDRRKRNRHRIRWRRYDADGDGALTLRELRSLVDALRQRPGCALVVAEEESRPTTHPSFRDRLTKLVAGVSD